MKLTAKKIILIMNALIELRKSKVIGSLGFQIASRIRHLENDYQPIVQEAKEIHAKFAGVTDEQVLKEKEELFKTLDSTEVETSFAPFPSGALDSIEAPAWVFEALADCVE